MTRPEQPQPYPGDPGSYQVAPRPPFVREFRDALGRPLTGDVYLRNELDEPFPAVVVDGVLSMDLPVGVYTLVAVLRDPEGKAHYRNERFIVARRYGSDNE